MSFARPRIDYYVMCAKHNDHTSKPVTSHSVQTYGVLQIQDRSPQSRPVASRNQSQTHSDATGLNCGDRSWICNAPLGLHYLFMFSCCCDVTASVMTFSRANALCSHSLSFYSFLCISFPSLSPKRALLPLFMSSLPPYLPQSILRIYECHLTQRSRLAQI